MDVREVSVSLMEGTTTMLKPTAGIAQVFTKEYIRILELTEYCKIAESNIKEYEIKLKMLTTARNESVKLRADYLNRNKINMTNSESLLQAKNELNKYKCEMKSAYIATERALKSRKLRYKQIISEYTAEWEKTLKKYNSDPLVKELCGIQERNAVLVKEIERQENLGNSIEKEFSDLKEKVQREFMEKIVEFARVMVEYKVNLELEKSRRAEEEASMEKKQNPEGNFWSSFLRRETAKFDADANEDAIGFPSIDVAIFDEIMVPSENLESQHEEEMYSYPQSEADQSISNSEDRDDRMDIVPNDVQHLESQRKNSLACPEPGTQQSSGKVEESQYFIRHETVEHIEQEKESFQPSGPWIQTEGNSCKRGSKDESTENSETANASEKLKPHNRKTENEEENQKGKESTGEALNVENEDSMSEGSVGYPTQLKHKPFGEFEENYDNQYRKNSSLSSDDVSMNAEHSNENSTSPFKLFANEQNNKSKGEAEKENFKSFTGFFSMGGDQLSPKPSIFKLF